MYYRWKESIFPIPLLNDEYLYKGRKINKIANKLISGFKFFLEKSKINKRKNIGLITKYNLIDDHKLPLKISNVKKTIKYKKMHFIKILKLSFFLKRKNIFFDNFLTKKIF